MGSEVFKKENETVNPLKCFEYLDRIYTDADTGYKLMQSYEMAE